MGDRINNDLTNLVPSQLSLSSHLLLVTKETDRDGRIQMDLDGYVYIQTDMDGYTCLTCDGNCAIYF